MIARTYATCCKVAVNKLAQLKTANTQNDPLRSRIGMFHDVVPDDSPLPDEYACHLADLARIVNAHIERGFRFISLDALLAMPKERAVNGFCVLTFDDGLAGLARLAAPYLFQNNIPFTAYITTGYLGQDGYITADALRALADDPLCTVGSHLCTHPMTRFLPRQAVLDEMTQSRALLERIVNRPVEHLAFPYGSAYACSLRDVRLARRAGYRSAALTTATPLGRSYDAYMLPRLNLFHI